MPKKVKEVVMVCPSCGATFEREPIIMIDSKTGSSHMETFLRKTCKYCNKGLVRKVKKYGVDKGPRTTS